MVFGLVRNPDGTPGDLPFLKISTNILVSYLTPLSRVALCPVSRKASPFKQIPKYILDTSFEDHHIMEAPIQRESDVVLPQLGYTPRMRLGVKLQVSLEWHLPRWWALFSSVQRSHNPQSVVVKYTVISVMTFLYHCSPASPPRFSVLLLFQ